MATNNNYITPQTDNGLKVLNHFHTQCNKALAYCKKQGLTDIKDFAVAVETISEQENPALKIATQTNKNGLTLWLAQSRNFGTTTGKYMMQHLGEEDTNKFTRQGIGQALGIFKPNQSQEINPAIVDALDFNQQYTDNQQVDAAINNLGNPETFLDLEEDDDIFDGGDDEAETKVETDLLTAPEKDQNEQIDNDLLQMGAEARNNHRARNRQPQTQSKQTQQKSVSQRRPINEALEQTARVSGVATQGSEVDGLSIAGLTGQSVALAALIGKTQAEKLYKTIKQAGQEHRLDKITSRLKSNLERADQLSERGEALVEQSLPEETKVQVQDDILDNNILSPETQQNEGNEEPQTPTEALGKAINKLEDRIEQNPVQIDEQVESSSKKQDFSVVDRNADISEQLDQIEAALSRIEKRLDKLEERIEAVEEGIQAVQSEKSKADLKEDLTEPEKTEVFRNNHPKDPNNSESDDDNHDNNGRQTATALRQIYQTEEMLTENADDGIPLGQTAILYGGEEGESVAVTIESNDGEELFAATKQGDEEWYVEADELSEQEKQQIIDQGQKAKSVRKEILKPNHVERPNERSQTNQIEV